ncbi:MAG: ABC transporter permease [Lachnospiraceae bacterium]|nr:ABC transporter permease [Lachnospiraceae bacterium]
MTTEKISIPQRILKIGIISWIIVLLIWGLASLSYDEIFLPSPGETASALKALIDEGKLWEDIVASVARVLQGWIIAIVFAVPLGLIVGHFKIARWLVEPILSLFRFVPAIALTSLFLMWFGVEDESKIALIIYAAFFPIFVNTIAGVVSTDSSLVEAAGCMGASKIRVFFTVVVPSAVPNIFTGIRLGLGSAIICVVAAEMLVGNNGLGYLIQSSRMYYKTSWAFAGIVTLALIGFVADRLLQHLGIVFLKHYGVRKA